MNEPSDQELLRRYVAGDDQAFGAIGRRHERLVYGVCLRELGCCDAAADATQETFLLLARRARRFDSRLMLRHETISGWLFVAARHVARNARRAVSRRRKWEEDAQLEWNRTAADDQERLWGQLEPSLDGSLAQLRESDRDAILWRFFERSSLSEIGERLGVSEGAAQMRVARALERLGDILKREGFVVSVTALSALLGARASVAAPARVSEGFASIAARGRTSPSPRFPPGAAIGIAALMVPITFGVVAWRGFPGPANADSAVVGFDREKVETLLARPFSGVWRGTFTDATGKTSPARMTFSRSPDGFRLNYRRDLAPTSGVEEGWLAVDRTFGRVVIDGRDVYSARVSPGTLFLDGLERSHTGTDVIWRRLRHTWTRSGDRLTIRIDDIATGKPDSIVRLRLET